MKVCQFCKMYMKPFMPNLIKEDSKAQCEFCGETIAIIKKIDGKLKWKKVITPTLKKDNVK